LASSPPDPLHYEIMRLLVVATVALATSACAPPARPPALDYVSRDDPATQAAAKGAEANEGTDKEASSDAAGASSAPGGKAPTFSLPSITTKGEVTIVPGKVTIVDFWATWCKPCEKAFPKLQELYVKYKADGLEIAAVSVDDEQGGIKAFAKRFGAKFPVGWDSGKKVAAEYKPETMPTTFIIDKKGVVRHVHKGYKGDEVKQIEAEIKALL
jgi:cytochrome c biogenesis protein CcmG, thiol:disulfide interchange protein DsbE